MADYPGIREFVQGSIRAEKARQNLTFADLSEALKACGIRQSATNLSTKVGRGDMSAQLFVAIMKVMGREAIDLRDLRLEERGRRVRKQAAVSAGRHDVSPPNSSLRPGRR